MSLEDIKSITGNKQIGSIQEYEWRDLMQEGVIATVTVGRWRGKTQLRPSDLGLPADALRKSDLADLVVMGDKFLLPPEVLKMLTAIESRARARLKRAGYETHWGIFVPVTSYESFIADMENIKQEYFRTRDTVVQNFEGYVDIVLQRYRTSALAAYDRLYRENPALVGEDRPLFADQFINRIAGAIPSAQDFGSSFKFELRLSYIPLPSLIDAQITAQEDAYDANRETYEEYQRRRAAAQMQTDVIRKAQEDKEEMINGFLSDVQSQLYGTVNDVISNVSAALANQGKLNNRNIVSLQNLVRNIKELNFWQDQDLDRAIRDIESEITTQPASDRSTYIMAGVLKDIERISNYKLIALGERKREPRQDIQTDIEPTAAPKLQRATLDQPTQIRMDDLPKIERRERSLSL